ncbi:hypothetical protein [Wolbachia endosymbiont of Trichogramma pretiosum]|uniref:hypothetical protein n=1 Tax=Wolbachia endosymbiont of Trichogramma pretiosum TaxID=125593 RepID=UPI0012EE16F4|nr:hypothetical protein [Wolbachia endosymbiont of Trichogramma pretiosum]OCA06236.1 hypothetical protein wTpre_561 [Wolbachia endosymbiont of Trichogramma pretiosum]
MIQIIHISYAINTILKPIIKPRKNAKICSNIYSLSERNNNITIRQTYPLEKEDKV